MFGYMLAMADNPIGLSPKFYDISAIMRQSPLERSRGRNELTALLCVIRDMRLFICDSVSNENVITTYFRDYTREGFLSELDTVSASCSEQELGLLSKVSLHLLEHS